MSYVITCDGAFAARVAWSREEMQRYLPRMDKDCSGVHRAVPEEDWDASPQTATSSTS